MNPVVMIKTGPELVKLCLKLKSKKYIGLDVETSLSGKPRTLCTVQISDGKTNWIVDALSTLLIFPLQEILEDENIVKIIHNASFEKQIFKQFDYEIENVFDTLTASRKIRKDAVGGHSLKAVCARELDIELDKTQQCSNWTQRPLSPEQLDYAAMDAEVLVKLYKIFNPLLKKPKPRKKADQDQTPCLPLE